MIFFYLQNYYILFLIFPIIWFTWRLYKRKIAFLLQIYTVSFLQHYKIQRTLLIKFILINSIMIGIFIYILNPTARENRNTITQNMQNSDVYIHFVLDVSLSMYAKEIDKTRMAEAVAFIKNAVHHNNAQIAFSIFTDILVQVIPFTSDTDFLFNVLDNIVKEPLIQGSSDIVQLFYQLGQNDNSNINIESKHLVILSDWESHTKVEIGKASILKQFYNTIFCVLVGSKTAMLRSIDNIPIRDAEGNRVYSTAQPQLAQNIAQVINAEYLETYQSLDLHSISNDTVQNDIFSYIISLCIALLLLGYIILEN